MSINEMSIKKMSIKKMSINLTCALTTIVATAAAMSFAGCAHDSQPGSAGIADSAVQAASAPMKRAPGAPAAQ